MRPGLVAGGRTTVDISGSTASVQGLPEAWCFTAGTGHG
jgi:hypothetical protein